MLNRIPVAVILVALAVAPAVAQTSVSVPRTFVDVTLAPDWDDYYSASARIPGATWRGGIAFGMDWGRSGIEFDVSVPQWHVRHDGPHRYLYAGNSFGWLQQGHSYEQTATVLRRSVDITALYRTNVPLTRHLTLTWLAGGGYVYRPERVTDVTNEVLPDGRLTEVNVSHDTSSRSYLAAAGRIDIEVRLTPQVSLVPRLRVTAFPSFLDDSGSAPRLLIARPEIGVRWQF